MGFSIPAAPSDFDSYWTQTMDELADLPAAPVLTKNIMRSTDFATVYDLNLTSIGPYRTFAYFTVPNGDGPFPAMFHAPRYGSVVPVPTYEERHRYVTLALCHRGQRRADTPYSAAYPGLLTDGIDDPASYIFRSIVADTCRAVDFLLSRPEVDNGKIAAVGNDLAVIAASLRPQITTIVCTPELFHGAQSLASRTSAYPIEEYNDYMRANPENAGAAMHTASYFEPTHFAPKVTATTLLISGSQQDLFSPDVINPLVTALGGPVERYESAHSGYKDGTFKEAWLRNRYGFEEPILPAHWS